MGRQLFLIFIAIPVGVLMVAFAIANRAPVRLTLDPFRPAETSLYLEAPLFLVLFSVLALGLLVGGMVAWWGQGKWRRAARARGREAAALRDETVRLEQQLVRSETPSYGPPARV
jgi:hypothetical protein